MTTKETHSRRASLLIVDESSDSIEVLRTIFELRGVSIFEADAADRGLASIRQHGPDVVVLDLELEPEADRKKLLQEAFESESRARDSDLVILGKAARPTALPADHIVAKPYHYGPLVRTIEQLLARRARCKHAA